MRALRERLAPHGPGAEDLASHLARLQGALPEAAGSPPVAIPDDVLRSWLEDPEAFASWLGISLFPYQSDALRLIRRHDRTCLAWGRQCGKDHLTSLYGLYLALTRPRSIVVCVSPSQRQSDLWMERLQSFALSRREVRGSVVDLSQSEISLTNASRVYSLPSGAQGSATIRGFSRVSLLVVNEAAWVSEDTFQAAQPFLAASGAEAKLVLISTPFGQSGHFWRSWNSDLFAKSHARSAESPLVPAEFLEKEKATMDSLSFAAEYEAQFLSAQNAYFPTELIASCTHAYGLVESPLPEHEGLARYLGADWARVAGADRSVLTVVGVDTEGQGKVLWIRSFEGVDYVQQAAYVAWLHGLWSFRRIFSDASNHAVNDLLRSRSLPVEPVVFTVPSKVELFGRLKNAMEAGRLVLPNHPDLLRELSTFEYRISEAGNLLLHHVAGGRDDHPDSLALAASAITRPRRGKAGPVVGPRPDWLRSLEESAPARPVRPSEGPRPRCSRCGEPIEPGQVYVGPMGRQHASCSLDATS